MAFSLRRVDEADRGREYELVDDDIVIGRDASCQIVIEPDLVSRRHARLVFDNNGYFIEDLGSRNGTYVNRQRIGDRVRLKNDDLIGIRPAAFLYHASPTELAEADDDTSSSSVVCTADVGSTKVLLGANAEEKLRAILRISDALGGVLDLRRMLDNILGQLFEIFPQADHGLVLLREGERLAPAADKHRREREKTVRYSRTIVEEVMSKRRAVVIEDATQDERFAPTDSVAGSSIRSAICAPLLSQDGEALGMVQLHTSREENKFDADDMHLLASVARQAAISVEYAWLHREKMKHARLERELDIARQVQYSLLPQAAPPLEGYSFWGYYQAAGEVGGDFYDYLFLPDGNLVVLLGDIAGKGIPAALKMVRVSTLCKVALLSHPEHAEQAMSVLNRAVCDAPSEGELVSLALCMIDPQTHVVTIGNAGNHAPVFCRTDGTVDEDIGKRVRGFMLGVDRGAGYTTDSTPLDVGESVVLFSDGITDAINPEGEWYTAERVRSRLTRVKKETAEDIGQGLLKDVHAHMDSATQFDDMSMVVFRRDS
ncbi:MAG: SpoIIE family protein phosphatase [Planctomycetota bacterium]|jgi:serine phosphatase RsbU (regulator of sigma subunit)